MTHSLDGKIALVTGAARGIGAACAIALAQAGADVALGLRDAQSARDVVEAIENTGRRALPLAMDMTDTKQIADAMQSAHRHFGRLDILVNNAGIGAPNAAENVTEHDFDATLDINLKGTFFASQAAGKIMLGQQSGAIINIGSQAGSVALPTESVYCMTKAAIAHLTKCLALEWAHANVRVNNVAPTFTRTPGTRKWLDDADFEQSVLERIPLGRIGEASDVAASVVFLASAAASMITGATLLIDGGWTLA